MHNELHEKYKHQAILILGSRPDTRAWSNEVGAAHVIADQYKPPEQRRIIRYGIPGSTDIQGFTLIYNLPIFFGVEVKSGGAVLEKNQKDWQTMANHFNVIHLIHRGNDEKLRQDFEDACNRCRDIICEARI